MSSVAIQGNAAGAGVFTIASPNSGSSFTATLPTQTGTLSMYSGPGATLYDFKGTASRATTVMTVTAVASGSIKVGDTIASQTGTTFGTVSSFGTGTGGAGTYNMSASGTIASTTVQTTAGTFTIPTGVTQVKVTIIGGGASGAGGSNANPTGGGAGGAAIKYLTGLTPGNTLAVTVGLGGASTQATNGLAGGTSSVASGTQSITTIQATGGLAASAGGGVGSGGDLNITGGPPTFRIIGAAFGGSGGNSILGGGGIGKGSNVLGSTGGLYGAGGSAGLGGNCCVAQFSGFGAQGIVIFEY